MTPFFLICIMPPYTDVRLKVARQGFPLSERATYIFSLKIIYVYEMETMETFEFDKLEIDYDEIIYVKLWKSCKGKIHVNHLKYKGGKPRVKIDGNLSFIFRPYK